MLRNRLKTLYEGRSNCVDHIAKVANLLAVIFTLWPNLLG